jgi:hypothetical protein
MMTITRKVYLATIITLLTTLLLPFWVNAQSLGTTIPDGFYLIASAPGVNLYRKDYSGGSPDFVQVVNLNLGARIVTMHGEVHELRPGKGAYGGNDARIMSQNLEKYWKQLSEKYNEAFCAMNGQFFYMQESPTRLPFPLKVNGEMITDGYGINEFPDQKLILELWSDKASISPLDSYSLYGSTAPDVIGSLTQTANKRSDRYVGRTFIGVDDTNQDGSSETVLIFNSSLSRQVDAANVLRDFGADQVMMFDGGGSTQLICQGEALISSDRPIPQAFGVVAASDLPHSQSNQLDPAAGDIFTPILENTPAVTPPADIQPTPQESESIPPLEASTQLPFNFSDVLWVPLMMTPIIAVVFFFVGRLRFG